MKKAPKESSRRIKVKLDSKTMIIINKVSSLKVWQERYPYAHIVQ